jgi:hypothetical protein
MNRSTRRAAVFAVVAITQGCLFKVGRGQPEMLPKVGTHLGGSHNADRLAEGTGIKVVDGKQEPNSLVARDGTMCAVSKEKFESTAIGASVWCTWVDKKR